MPEQPICLGGASRNLWSPHGRRIGERISFYGASYDRVLFDRYGYFSEALRNQEDSDFIRVSGGRIEYDCFLRYRTAHEDPSGLLGS